MTRGVLIPLLLTWGCTFELEPILQCGSDADCGALVCERLDEVFVCVEPCDVFSRNSCGGSTTCRARSAIDVRGRCVDRGFGYYPDGVECRYEEDCDDLETCVDQSCLRICDLAAGTEGSCECSPLADAPVGVCALSPED